MLLTGASGLLGSNLLFFLRSQFDILGIYHEHPIVADHVLTKRVDILDQKALYTLVNEFAPDIVVHAAALANVDDCENQPDRARNINVRGTQQIVDALAGVPATLVFISTDQVYDGTTGGFKEADPVRPLNVYAQTKADAEKIVLNRPHSLILRTNLFGWNTIGKRSLAEWCLRELSQGKKIKGFDDAIFSSIYTRDFADLLASLLDKNAEGIFNLASSEPVSKFSFLEKIAKLAGFDASNITRTSLRNAHFSARRGMNLSLDVSKLATCLGTSIPTTVQSAERFIADKTEGVSEAIRGSIVSSIERAETSSEGRHRS